MTSTIRMRRKTWHGTTRNWYYMDTARWRYKSSALAEGYTLKDGTLLNLSEKDQKWFELKDMFKF